LIVGCVRSSQYSPYSKFFTKKGAPAPTIIVRAPLTFQRKPLTPLVRSDDSTITHHTVSWFSTLAFDQLALRTVSTDATFSHTSFASAPSKRVLHITLCFFNTTATCSTFVLAPRRPTFFSRSTLDHKPTDNTNKQSSLATSRFTRPLLSCFPDSAPCHAITSPYDLAHSNILPSPQKNWPTRRILTTPSVAPKSFFHATNYTKPPQHQLSYLYFGNNDGIILPCPLTRHPSMLNVRLQARQQ
jgi:hypothetical protein